MPSPTPRWARTSRRPSCCGPHAAATPNDIRQFAIGRIADFKVPRQVLIVSEIPKGPTGKVQRVGLAAKLGLASSIAVPQTFVAPRTPLEKVLAECWAEILQIEQVGIHDDFFALGGDSLLGHACSRPCIRDHASRDRVFRFFEAPTVAEMAHHLETLIARRPGARASSAIARAPARRWAAGFHRPGTAVRSCSRRCRDMPFFNVLYALRLTSAFDAAILERSINEIVRRHEILRTTFAVVDGRYVQVIAPQLTVPLRFDDLQRVAEIRRGRPSDTEIIQEEVLHSFDLAQGPLFRARLVRLAEREHLLLITMHQIIGDGWSLGVLVDELAALYDAFSGRRAVAAWRRSRFSTRTLRTGSGNGRSYPDIVAQLAYWRRAASRSAARDASSPRPARAEPSMISAPRGARLALPASLSEAAKRFSHREGGTLFMALVAALKTLLHRYLRSGGLARGHARRQSQSSGDRGAYRPVGQYGHSPHQPRRRPQSSGGDASGSRDNPRRPSPTRIFHSKSWPRLSSASAASSPRRWRRS